MNIETTEEFAAAVPCTHRDLNMFVAKGIITGDLDEGELQTVRDYVAASGPYTDNIKKNCKVCGLDAAHRADLHRCCTKCGVVAEGFDDCHKKFGFALVKKYKIRKVCTVCRDCHKQYREAPEEVKGLKLPKFKTAKNTKRAPKTPAPTPAPTLAHAVAAEVVAFPAKQTAHRYPAATTIESGESETLSFGPIAMTTIEHASVEGATMIPKADKLFILDTQETVIIANALKNDEPTWIWGPSGVGKTSAVKQLAALMNWPLYRVQMSGDFTIDDFVGTTEVVHDDVAGCAVTKFVDGVLIRAMLNGGILLVDEFTGTPPSILLALQAVLERGEDCVFVNTANGGEVIHAHENFRIIVTDNTNGQGDMTGLFAGTNVMNEATRSRFGQWFRKDFPATAVWRKIIAGKVPNLAKSSVNAIVEIATTVNKGSRSLGATSAKCDAIINPRDTLAVARLAETFGDVAIAFEVSMLNSIDPTDPDRQYIADLVKHIVG